MVRESRVQGSTCYNKADRGDQVNPLLPQEIRLRTVALRSEGSRTRAWEREDVTRDRLHGPVFLQACKASVTISVNIGPIEVSTFLNTTRSCTLETLGQES